MPAVTFNYETKDVIDTKHVCYFTEPSTDYNKIILFEVVEEKIKHPEAPDVACLPTLSINRIKEGLRRDMSESVLMEANQNNISNLFKTQGE